MIRTAHPSTILIVDDEYVGRLVLEKGLHSENYRLIIAENGADALVLARAEHPDVIILDVMMPQLTGYDVCRQLREDPALSQVPILFITALHDRESRLRGLEAGGDEFITKPVDLTELRTRVGTITRLNRFRQLSEERERFESLVEYSPDGIVVLSRDERVLLVNRTGAALGVVADGASEGGSFFSRFSGPDAAALRILVGQALGSTRRCGPIDAAWDGGGGQVPARIVEITAGSLPWERDRVVQLTIRDVTERKELEAWMVRSQRIELLGQFSTEVVHDVNNMLSSIVAHSNRIGSGGEGDNEATVRRIEETAARAGAILRKILQFARGSEAQMFPDRLGRAAAASVELIGKSLGDGITITCASGVNDPIVRLDENQVHQLVLNLCVNARDAMAGAGRIEVAVADRTVRPEEVALLGRGARAGAFGVLSVRDSGTGMTAGVKARLFDPFFTTKEPGKGTGLGLAAVLRIMEGHGGFVAVHSEPGAGACFECHFPIAS